MRLQLREKEEELDTLEDNVRDKNLMIEGLEKTLGESKIDLTIKPKPVKK